MIFARAKTPAKTARKNRRSAGRPAVLEVNPAVRERLLSAIRAGSYFDSAAAYAGVTTRSFQGWLARGRAEQEAGTTSVYTTLLDDMEQALAAAEMRGLAVIGSAAKRTWCAAAWLLERRWPERWGRINRTEVEVGKDESVKIRFVAGA